MQLTEREGVFADRADRATGTNLVSGGVLHRAEPRDQSDALGFEVGRLQKTVLA